MDTQEKKEEYRPLLANLTCADGEQLCQQLRKELVENISVTGGHLSSNLGAVELMVAIHQVFDTCQDRLIFDVGHQCYVHKMLTGRREAMKTLRQYQGLSGFPKPKESVHDAFIAGHASNSVAVALGMAMARKVRGEDYKVLALIGDGALSGGLAYEGLSNAGACGQQILVILNDNGMSITESVGAISKHLADRRTRPQYLMFKKQYRKVMHKIPGGRAIYRFTHSIKQMLKQSLLSCSMFENMGFHYLGPVDGHDLKKLHEILSYARELDEPVLLHVKTIKGKGYGPAEQNPDCFHGVSPFDPKTGLVKKKGGDNFSAVFGRKLTQLAEQNPSICALTAAMVSGTGLEPFSKAYPERYFDVGIAEGCAVSMAAGMAKQGAIPVFAVYSTFLQRAYDMLIHDVAIDKLHVVLGVDRAGLVGDDGETHQGVFDVAYLSGIPGMTILAPSSFVELEQMLERAVLHMNTPVAVRYPRGGEGAYREDSGAEDAVVLRPGGDITLVGYGTEINEILGAAELLAARGVQAEVVKLNQIVPLPEEVLLRSIAHTGAVLTAEDSIFSGSVGERLAAVLEERGVSARMGWITCGNQFIPHGTVPQLKRDLCLDAEGITKKGLEVLGRG